MLKCFDFECKPCRVTRKDVYVERNEVPDCVICRQPMTRLACGGNFVLKGAGFHSTDYATGLIDD